MKIIDFYLVKQILLGLFMATVVLLPLFSFLDFVEQLDNVGQGFFEIDDAFMHVLLTTPRRIIQLSPFIALLGNVAALGRLAMNLEIIAMRSSGYSPVQISMASLKAGLVLISLIAVLEQFIAPPLHQDAIALRAAALDQGAELGQNLGIWTRNKNQILRIANIQPDTRQTAVEILQLGDNNRIEEYVYADGFSINNPQEWTLYNVTRKFVDADQVLSRYMPAMTWETFLRPEQIDTLTKPPESLSPVELFQYVSHLKQTGQDSDAYSLVLWRKLGSMMTTVGMLLFSIPFVLGSVRTGFANRLVLAGVAGIGIYLVDQIISNTGLLYDINLFFVAVAPGILLIIGSRYWLNHIN